MLTQYRCDYCIKNMSKVICNNCETKCCLSCVAKCTNCHENIFPCRLWWCEYQGCFNYICTTSKCTIECFICNKKLCLRHTTFCYLCTNNKCDKCFGDYGIKENKGVGICSVCNHKDLFKQSFFF
jgi:hypothetical protein